ncbi:UDP-N-acetylmuramate--L-alanine ligase [Nodosilinea sp. PGN35]|uniref:UDP-N-acetylmuramate--L-alanine ligase n=1 Tax=Nodosilinea sp. PGN35 TaxID=3020489 RepID=UPI0023B2FAEC|nr:UDP-N-acetylmuramate--L-alanine ligase [Nodosilinea sp. TSF1-S3]MDF0365258.1 UDP-N-acetylmuramate--L-alanine ligase [Nodosilinea sp. TSF1-S3]
MPISVDFTGRPFHFIGIGGIGMSALAYILTKRNLPVSGSDLRLTHITHRLQEAGAHIFWQQEAANLSYFLTTSQPALATAAGRASAKVAVEPKLSAAVIAPNATPQVVCSTAIDTRNPEYQAALELGCPILHRSDLLAALIREYSSIAVAGTHGKTTTSSMIGHLLLNANLDPTIVVGGEVSSWGGNARLGHGPYLVAEADESDGTLAKLSASIGVVTNIELDHTDHYRDLEDVVQIFQTFQRQCGLLVASADCEVVCTSLTPDVTYSLSPDSSATYHVTDVQFGAEGTSALVWELGEPLGVLRLRVLGCHNLSNALAAVAVGRHLGIAFDKIADVLEKFCGARRRFEHRGSYNGIQFFDDYAHHPSEIRATLAAARIKADQSLLADSRQDGRRVVAVFQPHRFSRTAALLNDFTDAFMDADQVIMADIYSAGEKNTFGVSGRQLAETVAHAHPRVLYGHTLDDIQAALARSLRPGDLVMFMGAGNLNQIIPQVMAYYAEAEVPSLQEAC